MQSITTGKAEARSLNRERFNIFLRKYAIIFIFLAMFIALALLSPAFLQPRNLLNIVRQISVMGLIAIGVTKVIISGGIDLSSGSVLALAAVIASSLAQRPDSATLKFVGLSVPLIVPIVAALAVGAFCGAINGTLVAKFKIPPFIATLG
ncbi:MAG: ABC transporter permease, partial [Caldilinea sp.]|nr:ABC transporter permease [Caldilinea sp.]MDW8438949.1 ABC transporter permease [Caldilineaceae bacterium]